MFEASFGPTSTKKLLNELEILSCSVTISPSSVLKIFCWLFDLHRPITQFIVFHVCLMLFFFQFFIIYPHLHLRIKLLSLFLYDLNLTELPSVGHNMYCLYNLFLTLILFNRPFVIHGD